MLTERVARGSAHPNECVAAVVVKLPVKLSSLTRSHATPKRPPRPNQGFLTAKGAREKRLKSPSQQNRSNMPVNSQLGKGLLGLFNTAFTTPAQPKKFSSDSSVASDASTTSTRSFSEHMAYAYQNGAGPAFKDLVRSISNLSDDGY